MVETNEFALLVDRASEGHSAGRLDEAAQLYETALEIDPDNHGLLNRLGVAHRQLARPGKALRCFEKALALNAGEPGLHLNTGNVLIDLDRLAEAEIHFRQALALAPNFADAHNNLGDLLTRHGDDAAAAAVFRNGLDAAPEHSGLHANLGNACHRLGDAAAAVRHLEIAAGLAPADPLIARNLGNALRTIGNHAAAETMFRRLLADHPADDEAHCLRAMTLFATGDFAAAWPAYSWRWRSPKHEPARPFTAPLWGGAEPSGKRLLVWGEQAVGDELMFATMIPDLIAAGADVVLECEHRLTSLFRRSFPLAQVYTRTEPPAADLMSPDIEAQIAIGDLGQYLRPTITAFSTNRPYLRADAPAKQSDGQPRIGISWRSAAENPGTRRSAPLDAWLPLLGTEGCRFVNLQYGEVSDDLRRLESQHGIEIANDATIDPLTDLDRFATLVASLDLVISVANTTVHISGALGVPTWTLLSEAPDCRWMATGDASPWYPGMRLLRMATGEDWPELLGRAGNDLKRRDFI